MEAMFKTHWPSVTEPSQFPSSMERLILKVSEDAPLVKSHSFELTPLFTDFPNREASRVLMSTPGNHIPLLLFLPVVPC